MASALAPTIPLIFPSCQLLIIPLIKVALQGNGSFVAQELICSRCSFPALNRNPQLGTLQLATAEPGTVSRRIRAPFGGERVDGSVPPRSPRRRGTSLRTPRQPGSPQPTSSGVPTAPHPCTASVPPGYFRGAGELQSINRPPQSPPSRETHEGLPRGQVALYDATAGTNMGSGGPT